MRMRLTLRAKDDPTVIPINYNYALSSAVYRILCAASPEYSRWLHDVGYVTPAGRPMKLFTFSRLRTPDAVREGAFLRLPKNSRCSFLLDSPMLNEFTQQLVIGLFETRSIDIAGGGCRGRFAIDRLDRIDVPRLASPLYCVALSPIVAPVPDERNGELGVHYCRADDPRVGEVLRKNLLEKYRLVHHTSATAAEVNISVDLDYVRRKGGPEKVGKLVSIKEGLPGETRVHAFLAPVTLAGPEDVLAVAMQAGVGAKNALGFGMLGPAGDHVARS